MSEHISLKNHFLIAMPNLLDPNFARTVTLICEHDEQGALGLVINRESPYALDMLLSQLNLNVEDPNTANIAVMSGGPVCPEMGFVLHRPLGNWEFTMPVTPEIGLTTSIDIMAAVAAGKGPQNTIFALGYAGWAAQQLEDELIANSWLTHPVDADMLFNTPCEKLWEATARSIGIDISLLSSDTGHA